MKHNWSIRRQPKAIPIAPRRWDQVYQSLLTWSQLLPSAPGSPPNTEEEDNESCNLRARIDSTPSPGSDQLPTTGAAASASASRVTNRLMKTSLMTKATVARCFAGPRWIGCATPFSKVAMTAY